METVEGTYYYGYRHYLTALGRRPSRDPIGERGGINLYGMVRNNPINRFDYLGLNDLCVDKSCEGVDLSNYGYYDENADKDAARNPKPKEFRRLPNPGKCIDADACYIPGEAVKIKDTQWCRISCDKSGAPTKITVNCGGFGKICFWPVGQASPPADCNWPTNAPQHQTTPPTPGSPPIQPFDD